MQLLRNFGPLFYTTLLQLIEFGGYLFIYSSLKVLPQFFSQVEVWIFSDALQHCTSILLFQPVLFCVVLWIIVLLPDQIWAKFLQSTFNSRILLYTEKFRVDSMTPRFPGPVSAKQAQINHSTYALAVYLRCLCYYAVCNIAKHATLLATLVPSDQMTRF